MSDSVPTTMGCAGWGQQGRRVLKGLGRAAPLPVAGQARLLWQVEGCSILGEVGPGFSAPCSQSSGPGWGLGGEASHQPQEHSGRQGHGSRAGGSSLHSPQHCPDSAGDAGFPPFASTQSPGTAVPNHGAPWQLLCRAGQEASPASPAQGSCPQTQELPVPGERWHLHMALGQDELSAGQQEWRRKPHTGWEGRHPCVLQARRSAQADTLLPGCWRCPRGRAGPRPPGAVARMGQPMGSEKLSPTPASPAALGDPAGWHRDVLGAGATLAGGRLPPARSVIKQSEQRHLTKSSRHPGRPPSSTAVICQGECLPITGTSLLFYCELYKDKKKGWA